MSTHFDTVDPNDDLNTILKKIRNHSKSYFPVVENGEVEGSVDTENLNEFISIQALSGSRQVAN
ncbi:MAG: CBS domain-containing protein [Balneolaceae bacterium]|nr:CBS domain-containing protein [Balneolaceae bacterium]